MQITILVKGNYMHVAVKIHMVMVMT